MQEIGLLLLSAGKAFVSVGTDMGNAVDRPDEFGVGVGKFGCVAVEIAVMINTYGIDVGVDWIGSVAATCSSDTDMRSWFARAVICIISSVEKCSLLLLKN